MEKKYRLKYLKNNKQISLKLNKSSILNQRRNFSPEREMSSNPQISKSNQLLSISRISLQKLTPSQQSKTILKRKSMNKRNQSPLNSPDIIINRGRSKTMPDESNLSPLLKNQSVKKSSGTIQYPFYVSKSNKMIETKQKLLKLKHNLTVSKQGPILQSIEESVEDDKLQFGRRMKCELYRNKNQSLLGYLEKNMNNSKNEERNCQKSPNNKEVQIQDLGHITFGRFEKKFEKNEKMQSIKKRLRNQRKNQLPPLISIFTIKT